MEDLKNFITTINWTDPNLIVGTVAVVTAMGVASHLLTSSSSPKALPLAPSPRGRLPILGHVLAIGTSPHTKFTEWSKELGPVFSLKMGAQHWIILNSVKPVHDLFDIRGSNYSGRHNNAILNMLSRDGEMYGFAMNGDYLRKWRRLTNNTISKSKLQANYNHVFNSESRAYLATLLREGGGTEGLDINNATYLYTINLMLSILYNKRCTTITDPLYQEICFISREFTKFVSDIFIDFFPALNFLYAGKIRAAAKVQQRIVKYVEELLGEVRRKLAEGIEVPSVVAEFLKVQEKEGLTDMEIIQTAGGFTLAGTDTSVSLLENAVIMLANHPEIQERTHDELFAIVGPDRLPDEADALRSPYLEAFVLEMFRFRPPSFFGIPHYSANEDEYEGYRIPANTSVVMNIHAMHFDESVFPNAATFDPSRHLSDDGLKCNSTKFTHWAFGAGRRICPGQFVAEKSLTTVLARLIYTFRVEFTLDPKGQPVRVPITLDKNIDTKPSPFRLRFVARHANAAELIGV